MGAGKWSSVGDTVQPGKSNVLVLLSSGITIGKKGLYISRCSRKQSNWVFSLEKKDHKCFNMTRGDLHVGNMLFIYMNLFYVFNALLGKLRIPSTV